MLPYSRCERKTDGARGLSRIALPLLPSVICVVVLAACGQAAAHGAQAATPPPAHALAWSSLAWSSLAVPQAFALGATASDGQPLAIAPSDGHTAYTCLSTYTANRPQIWATHDRGAHWMRGADVPATHAGACALVVDATRPNALIATIRWYNLGDSPLQGHSLSYLSLDGAHTWQALGAQQTFGELATFGDTTYALHNVGDPGAGGEWSLDASVDGLHTWHAADGGLVAAGQAVDAFWLNPANGALLVQTNDMVNSWGALWNSSDGGAHWSVLSTLNISAFKVMVQLSDGDQPWHLCAQAQASGSLADGSAPIACTTDGGRTWRFPSVTELLIECSTCLKGRPLDFPSLQIVALTPDGSLLGELADQPYTDRAKVSLDGLYRLPPGSDTWQPLGRLPASGTESVNVLLAGGSVLWLVAASGDPLAAAAGYTGILSKCYTASYP